MSLLDRLRGAVDASLPGVSDQPVIYQPIGVVRNLVRGPRVSGWERVRSDIVVREDLVPALEAIEDFSHLIVVFHIDQVPPEVRRLTVPAGNEEPPPERGVLATRSQLRPNPIGVSVVQIIRRRGPVLRVKGLDALHGTPVLDLKPYLAAYDAVPEAKLPDWAVRVD